MLIAEGTEFSVTLRKGEVETLKDAGSKALGIRVFVGRRPLHYGIIRGSILRTSDALWTVNPWAERDDDREREKPPGKDDLPGCRLSSPPPFRLLHLSPGALAPPDDRTPGGDELSYPARPIKYQWAAGS